MFEINNKTNFKIDKDEVARVIEKFLKDNGKKNYFVSIAIVEPEEIKKLNKDYRGKDCVTDILSFENDLDKEAFPFEEKNEKYFGELVMCYEKISEQAPKYSDTINDEFVFILVHGLLHLLGYEDESEKGRVEMEIKGKEFIKRLDKLK